MLIGMQAIGLKCLERRKARSWTQQAAAERAGVHRSVISAIENGVYTGSLKALTLYLTALDLMLTVQSLTMPQLDELNGLFDDD
jgi:transcriptional regulator with XRE-family HTH domain